MYALLKAAFTSLLLFEDAISHMSDVLIVYLDLLQTANRDFTQVEKTTSAYAASSHQSVLHITEDLSPQHVFESCYLLQEINI